ncbi:MAG: AmmeMemoRadiSam system protein B [Dehalococcoidia bacterium]|nr:AmmeMemoRadiSam system protein B [Dehalococcoidia bacterium]
MESNHKPKLRRVHVSSAKYRGQAMVVLQDPLGLSDRIAMLPQTVAPILELCDGTRDIPTLRTAIEITTGLRVGPDYLRNMLSELDEALFLENDRFAKAYGEELSRFRASPFRPAALSGKVYPSALTELEASFEEYLGACSGTSGMPALGTVRGIVSPHIDYKRGGPVYAQVWNRASEAIRGAELAIVLGTNHLDCQEMFVLTRQSYATPYGVLETDREVVDEIACVVGEEKVFRDELQHRIEHSVELAAVWLHHILQDRPCRMVPVLCGPLQRFIEGVEKPSEDGTISRFVEGTRKATADKRTVVIAAADLAHVGPAFGDSFILDTAGCARLSAADSEFMNAVAGGDAEALFMLVKREGDRRRICGLAPIYLMLRLLGETAGQVTGYAQCPADASGTSYVSICGMLLS